MKVINFIQNIYIYFTKFVYRQPSPSNTLPSFCYPLVPPTIPPPHYRRMKIYVNLLQE